MDGLLDMVVQSADFDALTATPEMVLEKKKFIGPDGAVSVGTMPDRGSPTISLPLNGTTSIPAGKYSGGKVTQNIPAMGDYTIYPTSKEQQIPTKGVYMGGNIIVPKLSNLVPENIKEGEYVGGVGPGTWKGFVVNDPYTLYYRGTFGPGQGVALSNEDKTPNFTYEDRDLWMQYSILSAAIIFNLPVNITGKNLMKIGYTCYAPSANAAAYGQPYGAPMLTTYDPREKSASDIAHDNLLFQVNDYGEPPVKMRFRAREAGENQGEFSVDVSTISRDVYVSLYTYMGIKNTWIKIRWVKFE